MERQTSGSWLQGDFSSEGVSGLLIPTILRGLWGEVFFFLTKADACKVSHLFIIKPFTASKNATLKSLALASWARWVVRKAPPASSRDVTRFGRTALDWSPGVGRAAFPRKLSLLLYPTCLSASHRGAFPFLPPPTCLTGTFLLFAQSSLFTTGKGSTKISLHLWRWESVCVFRYTFVLSPHLFTNYCLVKPQTENSTGGSIFPLGSPWLLNSAAHVENITQIFDVFILLTKQNDLDIHKSARMISVSFFNDLWIWELQQSKNGPLLWGCFIHSSDMQLTNNDCAILGVGIHWWTEATDFSWSSCMKAGIQMMP